MKARPINGLMPRATLATARSLAGALVTVRELINIASKSAAQTYAEQAKKKGMK